MGLKWVRLEAGPQWSSEGTLAELLAGKREGFICSGYKNNVSGANQNLEVEQAGKKNTSMQLYANNGQVKVIQSM